MVGSGRNTSDSILVKPAVKQESIRQRFDAAGKKDKDIYEKPDQFLRVLGYTRLTKTHVDRMKLYCKVKNTFDFYKEFAILCEKLGDVQ